MKKYNCNNTLEYAHEFHRMCKTFRSSRGQKICEGCPLAKKPCDICHISSEHIRRVQEWSDNHPETVLTDKQVEIFKALNLLGFRYIAKDSDGAVYAFTERPGKGLEAWGGNGEYFNLKSKYLRAGVFAGVFDVISSLVNWSDDKPLCIAEALEQAEEANP